ncbi:MAG: hypothetical protein H6Q78_620, partial [Candidatus Krumholzibacteriota bacterium]|nr:hypothetical protein [Candidatus Krumholzibacteriota bacterium]
DPLTEDLDRIKVLGTIIDGEIVYDGDAGR